MGKLKPEVTYRTKSSVLHFRVLYTIQSRLRHGGGTNEIGDGNLTGRVSDTTVTVCLRVSTLGDSETPTNNSVGWTVYVILLPLPRGSSTRHRMTPLLHESGLSTSVPLLTPSVLCVLGVCVFGSCDRREINVFSDSLNRPGSSIDRKGIPEDQG